MLWLIGGVLVVWLAVAFRSFRRVLAVLVGTAVCGVIALIVGLQIVQQHREREVQAAKLRIPRERIELLDWRMETTGVAHLVGRVRNNDAQYTLTGLDVRLRIYELDVVPDAIVTDPADPNWGLPAIGADVSDLMTKQPPAHTTKTVRLHHDIIGDTTATIAVSVPPHQVRQIDQYVFFSGLGRSPSDRTWNYDVLSVSGEATTR